MALQTVHRITSEHPCFIPVIGTFEAGETKVVDEATLNKFEQESGIKLASGRFAPWVTLEVSLVDVPANETEEA